MEWLDVSEKGRVWVRHGLLLWERVEEIEGWRLCGDVCLQGGRSLVCADRGGAAAQAGLGPPVCELNE